MESAFFGKTFTRRGKWTSPLVTKIFLMEALIQHKTTVATQKIHPAEGGVTILRSGVFNVVAKGTKRRQSSAFLISCVVSVNLCFVNAFCSSSKFVIVMCVHTRQFLNECRPAFF